MNKISHLVEVLDGFGRIKWRQLKRIVKNSHKEVEQMLPSYLDVRSRESLFFVAVLLRNEARDKFQGRNTVPDGHFVGNIFTVVKWRMV